MQVGKAKPGKSVHEAQGTFARLLGTRRAAIVKVHGRRLRKYSQYWGPAGRHLSRSDQTDQGRRAVSQCNSIHRSIVEQFKSAIVYGKSVKHQPQRVGLAHELADEDIGTYFWHACNVTDRTLSLEETDTIKSPL